MNHDPVSAPDFMPVDELRKLQLEKLQKIVAYEYERVALFRRRCDEKGVKPRIIQRRVRGQKKLTKWQEKRNKAIAKRRCGIEHIFGAIKHFGGDIVRSIGLARCKIRHGLVFLLYNMKRFCFLSRTGQLCPVGVK